MQIDRVRSPIGALTFPADDAVLAMRVREVLEQLPEAEVESAIQLLTQRLAAIHPNVAVRSRSELAGFGALPVVYVFRDGTALPRTEHDDWADDPSTARVITDPAGVYIEANEAAAELFGVDRDEIVGSRAGTFTKPDVRIKDADALWEALATTGRLHSLAIVLAKDGTEKPVEFLTIRDGDGPDRNVTLLRGLA